MRQGTLKIFLGMVAGVGKTYAMLNAAQHMQSRGKNVVVGIVKPPQFPETDQTVEGLKVIPPIVSSKNGVKVEDLDLDTILRLKPDIVAIDEMAHCNSEGMRHKKRYQDVMEILDHGISVFTTLKILNVESHTDTIRHITGFVIRETVPDSVIERADEIELIDSSVDVLLTRFTEGKINDPELTADELRLLFRKSNLTALRQIALATAARRVSNQLSDLQTGNVEDSWKTTERLMVAISPSPYAEQLIRRTCRLATTMDAPWIAAYIQTSDELTKEESKRLKKTIALTGELGGELVTTIDDDVVSALLKIGRERNVSQIIVGKSRSNGFLDFFRGGSLVARLTARSGDIAINVAQGEVDSIPQPKPWQYVIPRMHSSLRHYLQAVAAVTAMAAVCSFLTPIFTYQSIGILFLTTIALLALKVGRGPVLAGATLSAFLWDFLFIPPRFAPIPQKFEDILMVSIYFAVALITGTITARVTGKEAVFRKRERQSSALNAFVNALNTFESSDAIARIAIQHIGKTFNCGVALAIADRRNGNLDDTHPDSTYKTENPIDRQAAFWTYNNRKPSGAGTATFSAASVTCYPLICGNSIEGVIGIRASSREIFSPDSEALLQMFLHQTAIALERQRLQVTAVQAQLLSESERLNRTLLNSISHELRTPLATITGASSSLMDDQTELSPEMRNLLVSDIFDAANRLNRLLDNMLDMTRLETGNLRPKKQWCDMHDMLNTVTNNLRTELSQHPVTIEIAPDFPLIEVDSPLIEQALSNILLNAVQYTPEGSQIAILAQVDANGPSLTIEDNGPGLPIESLPLIFNKFYRAPGSKKGGTGLGLSISKGFVEAHSGTIMAENRAEGGARFIIRLPASKTITLSDQVTS